MSERIKMEDIRFVRKYLLIGALFTTAISVVLDYLHTTDIDYPTIRYAMIGLFVITAITVGYLDFIQKHCLKFLYGYSMLTMGYVIFHTYWNGFEVYDTCFTLLIGYGLGALFQEKKSLLIFFITSVLLVYTLIIISPVTHINLPVFMVLFVMYSIWATMTYIDKLNTIEELTRKRTEFEQSEARFRYIFENAPIGIALFDNDLNLVRLNKNILHLTGYNEEDLFERAVCDFVHPEDAITRQQLYDKIRRSNTRTNKFEQRYYKANNDIIWLRITAMLMDIDDEKESHLLVMLEDITYQKKAELKFKEYAKSLKSHNEALEEFSYVISHDLQEPLRMITSYSQVIQKKYISRIEEPSANMDIGFVIDGAKRMSSLIKDMLEYSRWTAKELPRETVETLDVLVEVLRNLTIALKQSQAEVICGIMPVITANRLLLGQVLQNLLGNALKYSHPDRHPDIRISVEKRDFDIMFSVKDNGIGFEEKDKERIFGIFQQLHPRNSHYGGTGMGLAICKRIIEKHGGHIWAESVPGEGSSFFFTLPTASTAAKIREQ